MVEKEDMQKNHQQKFELEMDKIPYTLQIKQLVEEDSLEITFCNRTLSKQWKIVTNIQMLYEDKKCGCWQFLAMDNNQLYGCLIKLIPKYNTKDSKLTIVEQEDELKLSFSYKHPMLEQEYEACIHLEKVVLNQETLNQQLQAKIEELWKENQQLKEDLKAKTQENKIILEKNTGSLQQKNNDLQKEDSDINISYKELTKESQKVGSDYVQQNQLLTYKVKGLEDEMKNTKGQVEVIKEGMNENVTNQLSQMKAELKRFGIRLDKIENKTGEIFAAEIKKIKTGYVSNKNQITNILKPLEFMGKSTILSCRNEIDLLKQWLGEENLNLQLIFNSRQDGDTLQKFEEKCQGKEKTLTLIRSKAGRRFGAYRSLKINRNVTGYKTDPNAFLFSLSHKEKCTLVNSNGEKAIRHHKSYVLMFGGSHDLQIQDRFFTAKNNLSHLGHTYEAKNYRGIDSNEFLAGDKNFKVVDLEVFLVNPK